MTRVSRQGARGCIIGIACAAFCSGIAPARADPPAAAVFPLELDDTSLQGELRGHDADDLARLARLDAQLRAALAGSGRYTVLAASRAPDAMTLRTCNGCETAPARDMHAQLAVTGWVQKVSNLILNVNIVVRDVATGQTLQAGSVDIRGDTDESWTRGLAYLLRYRILAAAADR